MARFAIFHRRTGYLEWIGEAADVEAAIAAARKDRSDLADEVRIHEVSAEEAGRLEDWWSSGANEDEFPSLVNVGVVHRV